MAANANTDTCACAAVAGRPPSPLLSCLRERARPARRGRDGPHSGWVDPQKRRADHGRRTDLSRRSLPRPPMPSLPEPAPAFSLLPSFWALPSFSLPLEGPSDLRLCPSVRWSFPTCSAIQAVPPLSVVPAGGPALALVPFLSPTKSQIKGKEGKAEDAMRKESQMEHGPHLSDGPREGAS